MSIEQVITESIERHVAAVQPPRVDLAAVRRTGRRRARVRAGLAVAVVAVIVGGGAYAVGAGGDDRRADDLQPLRLPQMQFADGLQGWFNPDTNKVHVGGEDFDIGAVPDLDTSASVTPYGLVFFGAEQDVHWLKGDGSVDLLAPAPEDPDEEVHPTVKFDAKRPLAAWLTGAEDGPTLTVYRFGDDAGVVGTFPAPCDCTDLAIAGVDHGLVFVRGSHATWVLDPSDGDDAAWTRVADAGVADVRNRVLLVDGKVPSTAPSGGPLTADWRFARAQGIDSLLTFDGAHELYWSATLRSTTPDGEPLELALPRGKGVVFVNMDSDGSVLVARAYGREPGQTWWDCDLATADCEELAHTNIQGGDPWFIGNDM